MSIVDDSCFENFLPKILLTMMTVLWYNSDMSKIEELQKQTLRLLMDLGARGKPLSARAAGEKLGIGYNQISDMVKGKSPGEKTLIKFASAVGESPSDWLRYAGKHDFARTLGGDTEDEEIDPDQQLALQIARELSDISGERRELLHKQIIALIRATKCD